MDDKERLRQFTERVLHVPARYNDIFGNKVPGMLGTSAESVASTNAQAVHSLQRNALAFAKAVSERDVAAAQQLAQDVEGGLLMAATLGVLTQQECDALLDELQALTPKS